MGQVGNAGHLDFDRNGDLALDFLGGAAGPLGDDLDVVVGDIRIGLDGKRAKADDAPGGEDHHAAQDEPAILQRKIYKRTNH